MKPTAKSKRIPTNKFGLEKRLAPQKAAPARKAKPDKPDYKGD